MSTKEINEEGKKLLESSWEEHEKVLVKRLLDNLSSYNYLIPKYMKDDIKALLIMANRIKSEYDILLLQYAKDIQKYTD